MSHLSLSFWTSLPGCVNPFFSFGAMRHSGQGRFNLLYMLGPTLHFSSPPSLSVGAVPREFQQSYSTHQLMESYSLGDPSLWSRFLVFIFFLILAAQGLIILNLYSHSLLSYLLLIFGFTRRYLYNLGLARTQFSVSLGPRRRIEDYKLISAGLGSYVLVIFSLPAITKIMPVKITPVQIETLR